MNAQINFLALVFLLIPSLLAAEESKESILAGISNFHSLIDPESQLEWKLFERDGSATVALNPVYLSLIITDNLPNGETKLIELPNVAAVKEVRFLEQGSTLMIQASCEVYQDEEGKVVKLVEKIFFVSVPQETEGKLGEAIIEKFPK